MQLACLILKVPGSYSTSNQVTYKSLGCNGRYSINVSAWRYFYNIHPSHSALFHWWLGKISGHFFGPLVQVTVALAINLMIGSNHLLRDRTVFSIL